MLGEMWDCQLGNLTAGKVVEGGGGVGPCGGEKAILNLALQFDNACTAKGDLTKAYEKCNDIPQESRALIATFLKEESDKDYEPNLSSLNNENDSWELSLDIDNSDLHLTPVLCPFSSTRVEPSPSTPNPVRIIPSPTEYMKKVVENVGEDEDFKSGSWVSATDYVNANGGTSCSPNVIGDLTVTMKYFSGAALILANDSVFSPKPSMHYLNIIKRNVINVFHKITVPGSGSEQQQLLLDEEALRETLKEEAKAEKKLYERIKMLEEEARKEQAQE
ncbi:hypothetical protein Tco_1044054 [Tanacetum coccineum]|uniref:Uncharacterized protein n=1 Tax=Tanacetum coccineum TaxID=301880 RepID=A0ABQ5GQ27_9ASTR